MPGRNGVPESSHTATRSTSIPAATGTTSAPPARTNASESGVPSTQARAPARPRERTNAGSKLPEVTNRSGATVMP
jgi:hypothetical protein